MQNCSKSSRKTTSSIWDDEKANLGSIEPCNGILIVGFLGLWNGNRQALPNNPAPDNIADCLRLYSRDAYEQTFYVDEKGEFWCEEIHHDGTTDTGSAHGGLKLQTSRKKTWNFRFTKAKNVQLPSSARPSGSAIYR